MKIRDQEITLPTSMVGNYPNPRRWDANFARFFTGDQRPPDSLEREALEDVMATLAHDQEMAGLDIISDGRVHGDNYADQSLYYYFKRLGYDLSGDYLGLPIYSRLHTATIVQEIKWRGPIMVEQARAVKQATSKPVKIQYPGIQLLAKVTNDLYYKSSRDRAMDLANAINEDILQVDALGVDFIQLDEFTWANGFEDWAIPRDAAQLVAATCRTIELDEAFFEEVRLDFLAALPCPTSATRRSPSTSEHSLASSGTTLRSSRKAWFTTMSGTVAPGKRNGSCWQRHAWRPANCWRCCAQ
jgi:Cobalamin-independent synthase, Catalytic domain